MSSEVGQVEYLQAAVVTPEEACEDLTFPSLCAFEASIRVPKGAKIRLTRFMALKILDEPEKDAEQYRVFVALDLYPKSGAPVRLADLIEEEES